MLATGIKSPIGVMGSGSDLAAIDHIAREVERVAKGVPGVSSALAERLTGGRYIDVRIDRMAAARYGLNIADVQAIVAGAIGGENDGQTNRESGRQGKSVSVRVDTGGRRISQKNTHSKTLVTQSYGKRE